MIKIVYLVIFLVSFSGISQTSKHEKAVVQTSFICRTCEMCGTCGPLLQYNLLRIKGVRMYEVDKTKNTIIVYYDGRKTDLDTIRTTIAAMGYDADDIKANSEARDELFNCCKKA